MDNVKPLHNLDNYLETIRDETFALFSATKKIVVIKKLIVIHDVADLALRIRKNYDIMDLAAMQELGSTRLNLQIYHRLDFSPVLQFDKFNSRILRFLNVARLHYPHLDIAKYITTSE